MRPKKASKNNHGENKRAFDAVLSHVRKIGRPWLSPVRAVDIGRSGGGSVNPARPNPVEFWADVFLAVKATCPKDISLVRFHMAYTLYDSDNALDCEQNAQKLLGDRRHSVEQRVGAEFVRRGIFPVQGKGYFYAPRRAR